MVARFELCPRSLALRVALGLALALHLTMAISVATQSVGFNRPRAATRPLFWRLHNDAAHRVGPGADFFAIYHAGVQRAAGVSPYEHAERQRRTPDFYGFRYLPFAAQTLGRAAQALPPRVAYLTWLALLELLLGATLWCVGRQLGEERWRAFAWIALLVSTPYWLELHMGQFTFATFALLFCGLAALEAGRWRAASLGLAAAALLKVFPLAALAAVLRQRRGFVVCCLVAGAVVAVSLPYFAAHPEDWRRFAGANFGGAATAGMHSGNHGTLYVLHLLGDAVLGRWPAAGFARFAALWQMLALGGTAALVLWARPRALLGGAALMFAHVASYKEVWEHHYSGVVVAALALLACELAAGHRRRAQLVAACVVALALPTPFVLIDHTPPEVVDPSRGWALWARVLLPACKALPTLVLWALALRSIAAQRGGAQAENAAATARSAAVTSSAES